MDVRPADVDNVDWYLALVGVEASQSGSRHLKKAVITVSLLFLAGLLIWLASRPDSAPQLMPEMVRFNPDEVYRLALMDGGDVAVSLLRSDSGWKLKGEGAEGEQQDADADAVQHLLDDLASMKIVRVVTRNPEHYEKLRVTTGSVRLLLKSKRGDTLLDLSVGKQGSDLISTYLRLADRPEVLAVDRTLLWQVRRPQQEWKASVSPDVAASGVDGVNEPYSEAR
ncbi:MAG: DUF4340 domain-containing protein [Mariprofundaceae bacterium]|nr:DUF4340 domain-containing protein [Mariprofundaceae bacterium]